MWCCSTSTCPTSTAGGGVDCALTKLHDRCRGGDHGQALPGDADAALATGYDLYMSKPIASFGLSCGRHAERILSAHQRHKPKVCVRLVEANRRQLRLTNTKP